MAKITFTTHEGAVHQAEIVAGKSLMQIATDHAIPGIDGDCGGECACGTCHVILDAKDFSKMGSPKADEEQMLSMTPERQTTSRLACQIKVSTEMDGMNVHLPEFQM